MLAQSLDDMETFLTTRWLARPGHYHPTLPSTNTHLQALAEQNAPAGTLIITDHQTAGKGRLGRRWQAPAGSSLLFSLLFRPNWPAEQATWLTMMAGLAVVRGIAETTGLAVQLKWPNDVVIARPGGLHKLGGLLLSASLADSRLTSTVMGMGINVNIRPDQLPAGHTPATSLLAQLDQPVHRPTLLNHILCHLETLYDQAEQGQSPQPSWQAELVTLHKPVRVKQGERVIKGKAIGTDAWGQLLVEVEGGKVVVVPAGDVTLR